MDESSWDFAEAVCREAERDVDAIAARVVAHIRRELPEYSVVPEPEQVEMVTGEFRGLLAGLAGRRPPAASEAAHGRLLGRRRAEQGIPVETALGAYHVGYQLIWDELLSRAAAHGAGQERRLLPVIDLMWGWLRAITGAVADGYATAAADREEVRAELARALVTGLVAGSDPEAARSAARGLGFDPDGTFQAFRGRARDWPAERLRDLRRALTRGTSCVVTVGPTVIVLAQGIPAATVLAALETRGITGSGLSREGLAGAADSLADADRALALAESRGTSVRFEADWLLATLLPQAHRLRPLIDPGPAAPQPHLGEAVAAYAAHALSIAASADALHVHPNTVKYRLSRWREITGWDPHTVDGLVRSLLSLAAAGRHP
ncbi:helix-turn-helix domain-containing protein [Asanoa siamensis]|uniref:PucR family transcriptional regulator n=1 Tax=Asanoa siamensis TaxID=926357 RepID=A0ABQ4CKQ9_9ACTN|nr:helix-turn-helix domain-containing protein [Asanoa siamensis]GIF71883.1 hypothetical protein Asi02nite_14010 [Asanoa siamensis]